MRNRFLYLALVMVLLLAACSPGEQDLAFETIAKRDVINYRQEQPALLVIASAGEVDNLTQNVLAEDPPLASSLQSLGYDRVFAILVLHGYVGSSGYSVTVLKVTRQGDQVSVWADFGKPGPDDGRKPAFTSPYHLIAVSREGSWGKDIRFALMVDGQPVAETAHLIP